MVDSVERTDFEAKVPTMRMRNGLSQCAIKIGVKVSWSDSKFRVSVSISYWYIIYLSCVFLGAH